MGHGDKVKSRKLDRAVLAGRRWQTLLERRAKTVRLLSLGGPELADDPERVRQYHAREESKQLAYARAGVTESFFRERRIGPTLDLDDTPPNETARLAGVPVGRLVELDNLGGAREGFATGFLIAPNLILTNHHVFAQPDECLNCGIQFGYEKVGGVLADGIIFALDATRFFYANEELDFAIVGVSSASTRPGASLEQFGNLALNPASGKILVGQAISIVQYPDGGPKKWGVRDNELLLAPTDADLFLQYTTDTLPGSSGSPAFNKDWEVVGLHHSGVPEMKDGHILTILGTPWTNDMPDSQVHWIANEGVRISKICGHLASLQLESKFQSVLGALVASFGDDPSRLPAIESQTAVTNMDQIPSSNGRGVSIAVNGTANFYFGAGVAPAKPALDRGVGVLPQTAPVAVEKKLRFDHDYAHRPGYDANFLGVEVPLPGVISARQGELLEKGGKPLLLKYHHYSLVMNETRRLQMWSAVNVDYTASKRRKKREEFGTDTWIADPRIPGELQIQDQELYEPATKFDRGHIVRRDDTAWGDTAEEEILANSDSFHFTNSTPQHENFNRAVFGFHGLWGGLENQIQSQAPNVGNKMCVFGGPILDNQHDIHHDFGGGPMQIPRRFWKVVFVAEKVNNSHPVLRAFGFILDQSQAIAEFGIEKFSAGKFTTFQVALEEITTASGVRFAAVLMDADEMQGAHPDERRIPIESLDHVRVARLATGKEPGDRSKSRDRRSERETSEARRGSKADI